MDETTFIIGLKQKIGLVRRKSNTIAAIYKHILFRGWYRNPIIIKTQLSALFTTSQMICNIYPYICWVFQISRLQVNTWNFVCKWTRKVLSYTLNFPWVILLYYIIWSLLYIYYLLLHFVSSWQRVLPEISTRNLNKDL